MEPAHLESRMDALRSRVSDLRGYLDYAERKERLEEIEGELAQGEIWVEDPDRAQNLGKEKARVEDIIRPLEKADHSLAESAELLTLAADEDDASVLADIGSELEKVEALVKQLEFARMFSGEADERNAFVDIQAGSGGTEAQDWADMLLRMYLRWCERRGFTTEILEASAGDVAGLKSASVRVEGPHAYGWLRTETGVHRLVRKSPFDSGARRHTSFAAVFVSPEIDDDIDIQIDPSDLRVDVYRASGAGGQHVNRTESAVRITHLPTNIVVQCQNSRSQHANRATAMAQLQSKLYERELAERKEVAEATEAGKADIGWGSQIRSYVLDQSRIKDLRTGHEVGNTQAVLDGDLDGFIEESLKQGI
ncbi:peptide chain release factor 2 [Salinisphaera sp. P385]|uniref:Peptide chain release factor 2 n=2 Tax=Spectribacter acetivorans TaxID=3075603 RepID=A0ABU3B4U2_9GAMM|nr:peptide chain release factor 2 [Salinisphaera sp. P385]MDT0616847.1 peptide chain release factor 2 [Salinisphaera sp. P385]